MFQEVVHSDLTGNADFARQTQFAADRTSAPQNARLSPKGGAKMMHTPVALFTGAAAEALRRQLRIGS